MLITFDPLPPESVAALRDPRDMPRGAVFQPVDMETSLEADTGGYRLTGSLLLSEGADPEDIARWLWSRVDDAAPVVVAIGRLKARVADAPALGWLLARARDDA